MAIVLRAARLRALTGQRSFVSATRVALRDFYETTLPEAPAAGLPPPRPRRRHRANTKRAGHIMQELTRIHAGARVNSRIESFRPGDAIEIKHIHNVGDHKMQTFKGVVLAIRNKGLGSNFVVRNVLDGEAVEYMFPKYSPLIRSIKVLQKAFIHKGRKRVRRAKLYYLRDRPPAETTVR